MWLFANRMFAGGTVNHFLNLLDSIDSSRIHVIVVAPASSDEVIWKFKEAGAHVELLPELDSTRGIFFGAAKRIREKLRKHDINILHSLWAKGDLIGALARRNTEVKFHLSSVELYYLAVSRSKALIYKSLFCPVTSRSLDKVLVLSPQSRDEFLSCVHYRGQLEVLPIGIDLERNPLRTRVDTGDSFVFGAMGRYEKVKGFDSLIAAFASLAHQNDRMRLRLAGEGPEAESLMEEAKALNVEDMVSIGGWSDDPSDFFAQIDAFVFPSRPQFDGVPNVILEAMAAGRPVVATEVGGVASIVVDGSTGFLVPPDDTAALAKAMKEVATVDVSRQVSSARQMVEERHSRTLEAERLQDIYLEAVNPVSEQ